MAQLAVPSPRRPLVVLWYRSGRLHTTLRSPALAEMEMETVPSKVAVMDEALTSSTPGL